MRLTQIKQQWTDFNQFFVDTHHPHLCFVGDQGPCRSLMASSHSQVKGRLPMRITVVDVLKCRSFFRPSKLTNYHRFGREISLDESQKFGKNHDSNPNLCYCSARSDILKNRKLSIPQKATTQTSSSQFVPWPSVCTILQENLHQSRVPLLRRLMQDRVPLIIQKLLPETKGQNSWKLSGWLNIL